MATESNPEPVGSAAPTKCPHCDGEIHINMTTAAKGQRMRLRLEAEPGSYLSAALVGGQIADVAKLVSLVGKDVGARIVPLIEKIETDRNGAVTVHYFLPVVRGRGKAAVKAASKRPTPSPAASTNAKTDSLHRTEGA